MKFFETRKGRTLTGLMILSGGGMVITQLQAKTEDPTLQQILQFGLIFWIILVGRLTYAFGWQQQEEEPQQAGRAIAVKPAAPTAKAAPKAKAAAVTPESSGEEGEESDSGKPRRRRMRRD